MKTNQKNKKSFWLLTIIVLSILPFFSILFTSLNPHTHDGLVHLARIAAFVTALKEGEFPVRWAGYLNYGYGMPLFIFIYQVPYFISSLLVTLGLGLVWSFKVTLILSFILSGTFMYLFGKALTGDNKKAFLLTIFYQFAPFRLVELLIRGSFGEVYAYSFLPLVAYGLLVLSKKSSWKFFVLTSVATALLVMSHNALSLVFFMICAGLLVIFSSSLSAMVVSAAALFTGLLLSAFYWMPALLEHKYTYGDLFMKDLYLSHFPPLQNFFVANWFNESHLQTGGVSVQLGIFHVLALVLFLYLLWKKKIQDIRIVRLLLFAFGVSALTIFFMQPVSKFIWAHVSILRQFQFSWRLLGVLTFTTALFSLSFFSFPFFMKKWVFASLVALVVGTTLWYWHPALGYDKINENYYWHFPLTTTYFGETDVIWSAGPAKKYPAKPVEFAEGKGVVSDFAKNSILHTYTVTTTESATIVDHTEYFPGWKVLVDGQPVQIQFQDVNHRGEITYPVSSGKHHIIVKWGEDKLRFFSDLLSGAALMLLLVISGVKLFSYYAKKRI